MTLNPFEIHRLETCEMAAWEDLFKAAPADVAADAGIELMDCPYGLLGIVGAADVLALNRVVGFGLRRDADPESPLAAIHEYETRGVSRFFVPISPAARPENLPHVLERYGLRHYNNWVRMLRDTAGIPAVDSDLEIREIASADAAPFAELVCRNFSWPDSLQPWIAATVGRPSWRHYLALDRGKPVATGAMFLRGHCAWFDLATTDAASRGRGAQSKLLEVRLRDALESGCNLVTMETAEQRPGLSAPSFRNAIRLGFQKGYVRPNYIWVRTPTAG